MIEKRMISRSTPALLLAMIGCGALSAFAHGDRIITHLVDGTGSDNTGYRTKIDIVNLGPYQEDTSLSLGNTKIYFYQDNGQPWSISTNLGTGSQFAINLHSAATLRIETSAQGSLTGGYAIIRSLEQTTAYPEDYEIGVTAYYEVLTAGKVVDTVSIPVGQPTVSCVFPVENKVADNLLTGLAVLNLAGVPNTVTLQLVGENGKNQGVAIEVSLDATAGANNHLKRAVFLNQLFPGTDTFKGSVYCSATGPVSMLVLLQSQISLQSGVILQYATLVPSYLDALRRNTFMYLPQGFPLDADIPVVDYMGNTGDQTPWDLLYEVSPSKRLTVQSGASFAPIGDAKDDTYFDKTITLEYLRGLSYNQNPIEVGGVYLGYAFAVKTGLGHYAKIRIADKIQVNFQDGTSAQDLALEIYVFK
jgi:hypothetical protein